MRRVRNIIIICASLVTCFIIYTIKSFDEFLLINNYDEFSELKSQEKVTVAELQVQTHRHVTPSLFDLGLRGVLPTINDHVLMLTRVPGIGAELLILILQRLQGYNAFKHIRLPPGDSGLLKSLQQELLVEEITSIIRQEAVPLSFDGDIRFLNFTEFGRPSPAFISLVRDPRTFYRFQKKGVTPRYDHRVIPHFCGQDLRCTLKNNQWSLKRAQENVRKWYRVVGILENMDETLDQLENEFPLFFKGAKQIYQELEIIKRSSNNISTRKPMIERHLQKALKHEIEFYFWLKSRLLNDTSSRER